MTLVGVNLLLVTCSPNSLLSDVQQKVNTAKGGVPVTGVSLNPTNLTLLAGGATGTLTATITPPNATNKNVSWSSDNTAVATVSTSGSGLVGVVTPGSTIAVNPIHITVTTADGNYTAKCAVTVVSSAAAMTAFSIASANGVAFSTPISGTINGLTFNVIVPYGTALTNMVADFTLSAGATASINGALQTSGASSNNFSNPAGVVYKITAADGTTTQNYTVVVTKSVPYYLTVACGTGGSVTVGSPPNQITVLANSSSSQIPVSGTTATALTANPSAGYYFQGWSASPTGGVSIGSGATTTVTLQSNSSTITATFAPTQYTLLFGGSNYTASQSGNNPFSINSFTVTQGYYFNYFTATGWQVAANPDGRTNPDGVTVQISNPNVGNPTVTLSGGTPGVASATVTISPTVWPGTYVIMNFDPAGGGSPTTGVFPGIPPGSLPSPFTVTAPVNYTSGANYFTFHNWTWTLGTVGFSNPIANSTTATITLVSNLGQVEIVPVYTQQHL